MRLDWEGTHRSMVARDGAPPQRSARPVVGSQFRCGARPRSSTEVRSTPGSGWGRCAGGPGGARWSKRRHKKVSGGVAVAEEGVGELRAGDPSPPPREAPTMDLATNSVSLSAVR
jgi:hypothetical protein